MATAGAVAIAVVGGFVAGRWTGTSMVGSAASDRTSLVHPAEIAYPLMNAWTRVTIGMPPPEATVMLCAGEQALACQERAFTDISHDLSLDSIPPSTPVSTYWGRLTPMSVPAGHLAGAFQFPREGPFVYETDVRLIALNAPAGTPGTTVEVAPSDAPGYFFDLGEVTPGSYALLMESNETYPDTALFAAGIVVVAP
jgi:hypothetical protein